MHICSIKCYEGRNIYSHQPVVKMVVDIGKYGEIPTKDIPNFNERLLRAFPGLKTHYCGVGYEGGFVDRLKEGTYLAHVLEHVILEIQDRLGYSVRYGKTRAIEEPSLYYLVFEYQNKTCAIEAARLAVSVLNDFLEDRDAPVNEMMDELAKIASISELGPSARAIVEEARRRGLPVMRLGNESLIQIGYGKYARRIASSLSDYPSCISVDIASNKCLTKELLSQFGIPVPAGHLAYSENIALMIARELGFPVVVKPFDGNQGKGVCLNIQNEEQVKEAYREASRYSRAVLVEKYVEGKDYRILVVGDKVAAVSERQPPKIIGDGIHTIEELVNIVNSDKLRGEGHEKPLTKIRLDSTAINTLKRKGLTVNSIPEPGQEVLLRDNGNLSTGGTAIDATELIHPENARLAVQAARIIGLDIAGIDMIIPDISKSIYECGGAIVEVNAAPGLRMHLFPTAGKSRNVAADIMDMLFPDPKAYSIPIVAVTGTNGKTTTTRLIGHVLGLCGYNVGMTTTSGIYIGGRLIYKGDNTGPISAKIVLSNREVEAAVLETARGGIIRGGLAYDLADVGVVTNVSDDHLGMDGINTLEELAHVKALVLEAVKPDGYAVINADDSMAEYLLGRLRSKLILFTRQSVDRVRSRFGSLLPKDSIFVYVSEGKIIIRDNNKLVPVISIEDIPITMGGISDCNIENALAAVSALYGLHIPMEAIVRGLKGFQANEKQNPGRFNMFHLDGFSVMVDYGHNRAGYEAVINTAVKLKPKRLVGIIGVPGDRMDDSIREIGAIAGKHFDRIYIKEDRDLRGRNPGEVAELLKEAVLGVGFGEDQLDIVLSEVDALEAAVKNAQPGDLIIIFYEEIEPILDLISKYVPERHRKQFDQIEKPLSERSVLMAPVEEQPQDEVMLGLDQVKIMPVKDLSRPVRKRMKKAVGHKGRTVRAVSDGTEKEPEHESVLTLTAMTDISAYMSNAVNAERNGMETD